MLKVGYIGLGSLGAPIAQCIANGGYPIAIYDVVPAAMAKVTGSNVVAMPSALATAEASDVLFACVRTDQDMMDLTDDGALFAALGRAGSGIFIIHSTISPDLARKIAAEAEKHGVGVLDCGVSRGGGGATVNGDLSQYIGGDAAAVARAKPLLDHLGSWQLLGPSGRGMEGKLLNNLVSIANYGMSAHILELGEHLGFDRNQLRDMLMAGSAQGFALRVAPGFTTPDRAPNMLTLLGKDVEHARVLADADQPSLRALLAAAQSMLDLLAEKVEVQTRRS